MSRQPRVLRSLARADGLHLTLEGRAGSTAALALHTDRRLGTVSAPDVDVAPAGARAGQACGLLAPAHTVRIGFAGPPDRAGYVRREVVLPLD